MWAIVLDLLGILLAAGGIYYLVSSGDMMGMPAADVRGPAIAMIVIGVMLMVPLVVSAVRRATER